ncbi:MAG: hydroxymethylglutaryl-CoA synthase family protein, partial [Chloroflexi bacterium]|nr:hydroxymethylglutaryl-CoA synthase family protein [Chloroflexota bacterium]
MAGISSVGAYIPMYRLPRTAFSEAWGSGGGPGERSVASHDEDTMTMAVNAAVDVLKAHGRDGIDGLFFASTTATYREKLSATLIAAAADLDPNIRTADFAGSLRAGTSALLAALDAVNAGSAKNVLVVASDDRQGYPRSDFESIFGDGAAAVVVSRTNVAAEITQRVSIANEITDVTETIGVAWATPAHDKAGNMKTVPRPTDLFNSYSCTYDCWNRLRIVKDGGDNLAVYEYDGMNRRVKKHFDSDGVYGVDTYVHYFYNDQWQVLEERESTTENTGPESLDILGQYIWSPRYIDALILHDYDADGNS